MAGMKGGRKGRGLGGNGEIIKMVKEIDDELY